MGAVWGWIGLVCVCAGAHSHHGTHKKAQFAACWLVIFRVLVSVQRHGTQEAPLERKMLVDRRVLLRNLSESAIGLLSLGTRIPWKPNVAARFHASVIGLTWLARSCLWSGT